MELKEFISNTLTQIAEGVKGAIEASKGKGYYVNPSQGKIGRNYVVHFDLSVENGKEGKADIRVLGGGMTERSLNRIKFDIHVTLPVSDVSPPKPVRVPPRQAACHTGSA